MKYPSILLILLPVSTFAQLNNGGRYAGFGIDADTRVNYMKYGAQTGLVLSDDWFSTSSGKGIIDTSNATYYLSSLQGGANISFSKRMSVPLYTKINGRLWLDAAYGRDYIATASLKDSTAFTTACKNGDNPSSWTGGITNFPAKDDLLDVYAHMRRDGSSVNDSLWLFTGASTYGTSGSRYYDVELYKNSFTYNPTMGTFASAGPDAGHTQWVFDAGGNITQTGDIILAVNFSPGSAPVVDIRIWVSQATWSTVHPAYFNFNSNYNGSASFGYASIVSKTGTTAFGAGISNYSATTSQDTTLAGPWGSNAGTGWSLQYQSLQFIEVGLNVTRIGLDPALYTALGPSACQSLFSNIFFKSRSSNSFTSNMQDFVVPLVFLRPPVMDYSVIPDTLRCNKTVGSIQVINNSTTGYYTWQTSNGTIIGSNSDSSQLNITKAGTYILSGSPAQGCPASRKDTIVIPIDTFPPVASVNITMPAGPSYLQLLGGDTIASNYSTPFGRSGGLLWNWSGPNTFTAAIQNPRTAGPYWGTYSLTVTEKRNGCTKTASQAVSMSNFTVLLSTSVVLTGKYANNIVALEWNDINKNLSATYEIEKYTGTDYAVIGNVLNTSLTNNSTSFTFIDPCPPLGKNTYRIKVTTYSGDSFYSNVMNVTADEGYIDKFKVLGNSFGTGVKDLAIVCSKNRDACIVIYNTLGQALWKKNVRLHMGRNDVNLPTLANQRRAIQILSIFFEGELAFSQGIIF